MKKYHLFIILFFFTSCNGHDKTVPTKDTANNSKIISSNHLGAAPVEDPNFVETADTITTHGPHSITRNILQDKNGNIWFASWEGIICYDGKSFTNFTLKENLKHFHVFSVLEDKLGNLWFGTIGGGAYKYDGKNFTLYSMKDGLVSNLVDCMMEDLSGNIWFGTDNGASCFDGKTFANFTLKDGLCGNSVASILQDKAGKVWFGTNEGVSCYFNKTFSNFKNTRGVQFHNVRSIVQDKNGNIWIGSDDGLCSYDGNKQTTVTANFIGNIFEDKIGNLWLSEGEFNLAPILLNGGSTNYTFDGMSLYRYDGKSFTKIMKKMDLNDNQVFGITEDKTENIWFGTMQGVYCYDGKSFNNFSE